MIIWCIIWGILLIATGLMLAMEVVNGSNSKRVVACFICVCFLILIPVFVLGAYHQSVLFWNEYAGFAQKAQNLTESQEYAVLGHAINYNYKLYKYQTNIHRLGIFAPYYHGIWDLKPIQLKNFDMTRYRWWE